MHAEIAKRRDETADRCSGHGVAWLGFFGSVARNRFRPGYEQLSVLMELDTSQVSEGIKRFHAFQNALAALGGELDLLGGTKSQKSFLSCIGAVEQSKSLRPKRQDWRPDRFFLSVST